MLAQPSASRAQACHSRRALGSDQRPAAVGKEEQGGAVAHLELARDVCELHAAHSAPQDGARGQGQRNARRVDHVAQAEVAPCCRKARRHHGEAARPAHALLAGGAAGLRGLRRGAHAGQEAAGALWGRGRVREQGREHPRGADAEEAQDAARGGPKEEVLLQPVAGARSGLPGYGPMLSRPRRGHRARGRRPRVPVLLVLWAASLGVRLAPLQEERHHHEEGAIRPAHGPLWKPRRQGCAPQGSKCA
mmetsp:Transcript_11755/g.36733  ORF Transcript_11755/g.36733 Transcript_11755/m.36733 type:complete len:248 (-) Transcript_11755:332-1075(-)